MGAHSESQLSSKLPSSPNESVNVIDSGLYSSCCTPPVAPPSLSDSGTSHVVTVI